MTRNTTSTKTTRNTMPTITMFMKTLLIPSLLALMLWSCASPLDTDTPRKVTPITPAIKVAPLSISPEFNTATGTFKFKGNPTILVDTTVSPMAFWMDFAMENVPDTAASAPKPVVVEFRIKVDSFPSNGLIQPLSGSSAVMYLDIQNTIEQFSADDVNNSVTLLVSEHMRVPGEKRKVTIYVYMIANKSGIILGVRQDPVLGTIELEI